MCYGHQRQSLSPNRPSHNNNALVVDTLRVRLAETEARLEQARAREAELTRRLEEMKRFVSVMEILESYLKQRFHEQREYVERIFSSLPAK
ncbi:Protein SKIP34 [Hibiscus syriacus]|uniref:Protein SKIP34 n=1 Tax=Hibiscus syriacus TaxID=106335 RepID=A0A6A2XPP7_HIBSY|nr:protein SKIP34-like [Hibiscus syriacus]KAE8655854.1 Protein SKIP34 [Hibiscus syriacus]